MPKMGRIVAFLALLIGLAAFFELIFLIFIWPVAQTIVGGLWVLVALVTVMVERLNKQATIATLIVVSGIFFVSLGAPSLSPLWAMLIWAIGITVQARRAAYQMGLYAVARSV